MNKKSILSFLFLLPLVWAGCVGEDLSDCPTGLYVTFMPQNPANSYTEGVQHVDLYFYKPDGALADIFRYERGELREGDLAAFVPTLPDGEYRVLAVVNCGIYTHTDSLNSYSTVYSELLDLDSDEQPTAPFFSSETTVVFPAAATRSGVAEEVPMTLYKHDNQVRLNVYYADDYVRPDGPIETWIEGDNGKFWYSADGCPSGEESVYAIHRPWQRTDNEDGSIIYMSTMHLWHDSDVSLYFQETGSTRAGDDAPRVFALDLPGLLAQVAQIVDDNGDIVAYPYATDDGLRFYDEYEISVKIGKTFAAIEVSVDNWAVIQEGVEL